MAKKKTVDLERFTDIRGRIVDLYQFSGQIIREKRTMTMSAVVFREQKWLVDTIEDVAGGVIDDADKPRYEKVKKFVQRVNTDYEGAIKGGEFIKVSAEIFGASRFLVKCLERVIVALDEEAGAKISLTRMPDEKQARIELSLDEDLVDSPEETDAAIAEAGALVPAPDLNDD